MKIFVETQSGTTVPIEVESSATIYNVWTKIQVKERIPRDQHILMFVQQYLRPGRTLAEYGIGNESTLHLVERSWPVEQSGGPISTRFVDLENNDALQRIAFTYDRELNWRSSWCRVMRGLNIEGKCTRSSCPLHAKGVISHKYFCAFDITTERSTCRECRCTIKASTCGFTDCEWMYSGRKRGSAIDITSEWQVVEDEYERFREASNMADWEVLVITARPNPSPRPECVMCLTDMLWEEDRQSLECGCRFHRDCVVSWKLYETHCPTCRVEICRLNNSTEGRQGTSDISIEGREIRPNISMIGTSQRQ